MVIGLCYLVQDKMIGNGRQTVTKDVVISFFSKKKENILYDGS